MANKVVNKIEKEKRAFDKTYIPLGFAIFVLVILIVSLALTIFKKPKDKPVVLDTNTAQVEEVIIENQSTLCNNDEMKSLVEKAKNIKAMYFEIDDYVFGSYENANAVDENGNHPIVEEKGYALRMAIYDGSDDLYAIITNNLDDKTEYQDFHEGSISWEEGSTRFLRRYNVEVYSNTESCKGVLLREFEFTVPKWNEMSKWPECNDPLIKDEPECKHFIMEDKSINDSFTSINKLYEKIEKAEEKKKQEEEKMGATGYLKKYLVWIIVAVVLIISGIVVFIVMRGRKKHEK